LVGEADAGRASRWPSLASGRAGPAGAAILTVGSGHADAGERLGGNGAVVLSEAVVSAPRSWLARAKRSVFRAHGA
jgi:hypothetical protein